MSVRVTHARIMPHVLIKLINTHATVSLVTLVNTVKQVVPFNISLILKRQMPFGLVSFYQSVISNESQVSNQRGVYKRFHEEILD